MIFIPGNVPSLKNSKIATTIGRGKNKRTILLPSKSVKRYLQNIGISKYSISKKEVKEYKDITRPNLFKTSIKDYFKGVKYPCVLGLYFVRDSKRKFDFHNACQIIADLLVAHGFIEDDNMDCFIPMPMTIKGKWYHVDKKNTGVWLHV